MCCVCVWIDASMSFVTTYKYIILYNVYALSSQPFPFNSSFDVFPIHAFLSVLSPISFIHFGFCCLLSLALSPFFHIHVILFMHAVHSASHFVYINVIDSLTLTPWPIKSFNIALTCNRTLCWVPSFRLAFLLNWTETETKPKDPFYCFYWSHADRWRSMVWTIWRFFFICDDCRPFTLFKQEK